MNVLPLADVALFAVGKLEGPQRSFFMWFIESQGFFAILIPLIALAIFIGACCVVGLSRRPTMIASYLVLLPLPVMIGVFAFLKGSLASFSVLALSDSVLKPSEWYGGMAEGLMPIMSACVLSWPTYFVLAFGLLLRTALAGPDAPRAGQ